MWKCAVSLSGRKPGSRCLWRVERSFPHRRSGGEERLSFLFQKSFPFQLGNFLNQFLHQAIVVNGLANALLPGFWDTNLSKLPRFALHHVQRLMQFPSGTTAIRLATGALSFRESATKKPLTGGKLRNTGTEVALDGGEFAAVHRVAHTLYMFYIQDTKKSQEQKHNANLLSERTSTKT